MEDLLNEIESGAELSPCGTYRYQLWRKWGRGPIAVFIMLNPSTADAHEDDPTIRRCIGFARREGCGGLKVVNLYAYRATDPKELIYGGLHPPAHERTKNNSAISSALAMAKAHGSPVIAAWGAGVRGFEEEPYVVRGLADRAGVPLMCLGTTNAGHPKHPLYLAADTPLVPLSEAA